MRPGCLLAVALAVAAVATAGAQSMSDEEEDYLEEMGVTGKPMGRKDTTPKAEVIKSDLKYIRCDVCRRAVELAYTRAQEVLAKRFSYKSKRKNEPVNFDGEAAVQEYIEQLCVVDKPKGPGQWIQKLDLIADGDRLVIHEYPGVGHCARECRTIERACDELVDAADTEFSEILFASVRDGLDLEKVQRQICNRLTGYCKKPAPKVDAGRHDEPFRMMDDDELRMAEMMANLKESGMGGTMYKRDDLMKGMDAIKSQIGDLADLTDEEGFPAV